MEGGLRRSPLEAEHEALGAKMMPFAGWRMPLEYVGVLREHRAVRERVGIFDLTHLGKIEVRGPGALARLQRVLTGDLSRVEVGAAQYGLVLNEAGGIVDDLITYRRGPDAYLVVPNAANTGKVLARLAAGPEDAEVEHLRDAVTIAVQGPRSTDLASALFAEAGGLAYMRCVEVPYGGGRALLARSGYTGERGYEIFVGAEAAPDLWRALLEAGRELEVQPCGLGARDTLRLEMGYPLHGNDISEDRTPLEAGLSWAVALDKGEFTGREALLRQKEEGVRARLRGLRAEGTLIPRAGNAVLRDGVRVGETTSGTFSPTLRVGIALAYLDPAVGLGDRVEVEVRGRRGPALVVKPPFVESSPR